MIDSYYHIDSDVIYISENIPGPSEQTEESEELLTNFNSQLTHNCNCSEKCLPSICECLEVCGGQHYTLRCDQNSVTYKLNRNRNISYPIVECNDFCKCSSNCGNRVVQNGPIGTLFVKASENELKGLGLFTNTYISEGTFICEYAGEVLTKNQTLFRHSYNERHGRMNYIFCLNEHVNGKTLSTYIDPSHIGNIGRYINHSCDPNCVIIPVRVNSPIVKLALFSIKNIMPYAEITFDYGSGEENLHVNNVTRKLCLCNTSKCKGFMPCLPC